MSEKKQTILEWYQQNHKFIDSPCDGKGNCGRCKIRFLSEAPAPQEKEKSLLTEAELTEGVRLACVTEMQDDAHFVPEGEQFTTAKIMVSEAEEGQGSVVLNDSQPVGIAIDIGTTTLAMSVVNLLTGEIIKTITSINHQRVYGADVISRIQAANSGKSLELQICVLQDIWNMLLEVSEETGMKSWQIKKIAIAGNTVMCHLLLGYSCQGLGRAPFVTENISLTRMNPAQLFEKIRSQMKEEEFYSGLQAEVVILPGISAFVGADIVSGMYYCDMDLEEEPQMLLDIGTNGEIVIGNRQGFFVTSTAAGPVFEGGNISCGMPAVRGAISHVKLQKPVNKNGKTEYGWDCEVIEGSQYEAQLPKGFCGSGLIDLAAALMQAEWIDENGTLIEEFFETGVPVQGLKITQSDIRELQMGKAAIRAGMEILFQKIVPERVFLAGGFGTELDINAAIEIGLLPKESSNRMIQKGNTSLKGLQKFLLDENGGERLENIRKKSREIVLAEDGNFAEKYILFMQFLL